MPYLPLLEFNECYSDSPYFRTKLKNHEEALATTSNDIKLITKDLKAVLEAENELSKAQRNLSNRLQSFKFTCVGESQTEDELLVANSLAHFGSLISYISDERQRMLENAMDQYIKPLDKFRKETIGNVKLRRKSFEKEAMKYYSSQEKCLASNNKKDEAGLKETEASLTLERRHFFKISAEYVKSIQDAHERKKFEFVEILINFINNRMCYYHYCNDLMQSEYREYCKDLQLKVQKSRENYRVFAEETCNLMGKITMSCDPFSGATTTRLTDANEKQRSLLMFHNNTLSPIKKNCHEGYLFLKDFRRNSVISPKIGSSWTKYYVRFDMNNCILSYRAYSPTSHTSSHKNASAVNYAEDDLMRCVKVSSFTEKLNDSFDRRYCIEICGDEEIKLNVTGASSHSSVTTNFVSYPTNSSYSASSESISNASAKNVSLVFQCSMEEDRHRWTCALRSALNMKYNKAKGLISSSDSHSFRQASSTSPIECVNEDGMKFVEKCLTAIEKLGIDQEGIYRTTGVKSKVNKLLAEFHTHGVYSLNLLHNEEYDVKVIASGLKSFLRGLPEPVMSWKLYDAFIEAAKDDDRTRRVRTIMQLVARLPNENRRLLSVIVQHLAAVAQHEMTNCMSVSNLAVCFGPTLLRAREESIAGLVNVKWGNIVIEILIENWMRVQQGEEKYDDEQNMNNLRNSRGMRERSALVRRGAMRSVSPSRSHFSSYQIPQARPQGPAPPPPSSAMPERVDLPHSRRAMPDVVNQISVALHNRPLRSRRSEPIYTQAMVRYPPEGTFHRDLNQPAPYCVSPISAIHHGPQWNGHNSLHLSLSSPNFTARKRISDPNAFFPIRSIVEHPQGRADYGENRYHPPPVYSNLVDCSSSRRSSITTSPSSSISTNSGLKTQTTKSESSCSLSSENVYANNTDEAPPPLPNKEPPDCSNGVEAVMEMLI